MTKQTALLFRDDRRIEVAALPVRNGCLVDADNGRAWDVSAGTVVDFQGRPVVLLVEHEAVPLDLSAESLLPNGLSEEKLRTLGIEAFNQALVKIAAQPERSPIMLFWWISLMFALGVMLLVMLSLWQSGNLKVPWP